MALEIIGMFVDITGGAQNAAATIDVPQDGVLRGIDWDLNADLDADSEEVECELSFIATSQLGANDQRGRLSSISARIALTTSGSPAVGVQKWIGPMELMLSGGERIHIHVVSTAGVTGAVRCNLHFDGGATVTRRSRRR